MNGGGHGAAGGPGASGGGGAGGGGDGVWRRVEAALFCMRAIHLPIKASDEGVCV